MIKKILYILLIVAVLAGMMVLLGHTSRHNLSHTGNGLQVVVDLSCGNQFVGAEAIRQLIYRRFNDIDRQGVQDGMLQSVKFLVEGDPFVKKAAVYRNINGDIRVEVTQRMPLIRVSNSSGQGFYIDREGKTMPLSSKYTARVMIASGFIQTAYFESTDLAEENPHERVTATEKRLRNLFELATYIDRHPFWKSMIDQIRVTQSGEFELIPMNGAHVIVFGSTDNMEEKFGKLHLFYKVGLSQSGWNLYTRINVKYARQVVCSK